MTGDYYEVIIDGEKIDLYDQLDVPINLSYVLLDLNYFDKRGGSFSNIFKVPATKRNNIAFNWYYDGQIADTSKFIKEKPAQVIVNGVVVFDGYISGKASYEAADPESYEANIKGGNIDWASKLSDLPLVDLTYPTVNYNGGTIRDSWDNTWVDRYVAPLVFYGRPSNLDYLVVSDLPAWENNGSITFNGTRNTNSRLIWEFHDFRFWLFIRPLLEEMFEKAGYKFVSSFIQNPNEGDNHIMYINDLNVYNANERIAQSKAGGLPYAMNLGKDLISPERKCIDLLKGMQNQFNFFFFTDEKNKTVYCEPYKDFFTSSINWEVKVDYSKLKKTYGYEDHGDVFLSHKQTDPMREFMLKYNHEKDLPHDVSLSSIIPPYKERWYYPGVDYFKSGIRLNKNLQKKENENRFFGSYFMGLVPTRYTGGPFKDPLNYKGIMMPIITDDNFGESVRVNVLDVGLSTIYPLGFRPFPEQDVYSNPEPRFGYYAGVKSINAYERSSAGEFYFYDRQISSPTYGFQPTPDPEYKPTTNPHPRYPSSSVGGWYAENNWQNTNTRPFVYNCDFAKEDDPVNPRNYQYSSQITVLDKALILSNSVEKIKGLAEIYYAEMLTSIYSDKVRRIDAPLKINESDLQSLDFRSLIEINRGIYILLEIAKYNPLVSQTTLSVFMEKVNINPDELKKIIYGNHHFIDLAKYYFAD
jgi:hypothetical protein